MKSAVLATLAAILLFPLSAWAADATSYVPAGVPQYPHIPMGGSQVQNAGSYGLSSGGAVTSNGGPGSSTVLQSASGVTYVLNNAWSDGVVSTGAIQDYNNPGYYLDPNGTSNVNRMLVNYGPTAPQDAANKAYVDAQAGTGNPISGWQWLPSGLIMQWGATPALVPNDTTTYVSFPVPFPTAVKSISVSTHAPIAVNNSPQVVSYTRFGATLRNKSVEVVAWGGMYIHWTAYGY